ncbi:MAG: MotA/TolQ/ExbB proton channel family protein [Candidatus Omnitrophica bacterium]|nr:MotA/TolQ/ExbB proton channel family protein [Candidatus Omnitrophota bacterium]
MIAIGLSSIAAGTFAIIEGYRLWQALRDHSKALADLEQPIQKRDWTRALQVSDKYNHPFLKPWRTAFFLLIEGKSDLRDIEEAVSAEGTRLISYLESALKPLGALTAVLPMLGFLGTILGLILSFEHWEHMGAQVSISALAGGIYQAMITTAAGLIAAIPYHLLYYYFHGQAEKTTLEFSRATTQLFRWIKEGLLREPSLPTESLLNTNR